MDIKPTFDRKRAKFNADYAVVVDGEVVGHVRKFRERTQVLSGAICVGWAEATRWAAYDNTGRRLGFSSSKTRKAATDRITSAL